MAKNIISLLTFSWHMNNTINNQGDHCIVADCNSSKLVGDGSNQMLITSHIDECKKEAWKEIETLNKFASNLFSLTK